ncbi:MAG TPA: glycoside hydrolase family 3 C-terminal domain-containing protein [Limnochordia bacterium]|jgi:beta-glucosidase|nr:glycoside hydrolase family 3 C-terminal domain-containing protein [Limnochordia bacterium]
MDIDKLLEELEVEEKIALVSGSDQWHTTPVPRLNLPAIMLSDGPHGLRKQELSGDNLGLGESVPATCFPPAATSANSWDPELLFAMGQAIGAEARQQGVSVVLGPGVNIKRSPLCGRNFEYFSEDPYLAGQLATAWIKGVQSQGVGACLKHFAANNQEKWRMLNDSLVDERALREIYLAAFEQAVREAQPWTVMGAYNKVNGTYACEHKRLLETILREEWGFQGAVISDWGAVNDPSLSLEAGLDLEMPASHGVSAAKIRQDLKSGRLSEAALDKAVRRVLELVAKAQEAQAGQVQYPCDYDGHHLVARRVAAQSAVLLKNKGGLLPLGRGQKVAVLGEFARQPRYQGAGSSQVNPTRLETVLEELEKTGARFDFAPGYSLEDDVVDERLLDEACRLARRADVAVIFAGLPPRYESEGYDRAHLDLPPNHNALIARVAEVNPNVVVVLSAGAPVAMPWLDQVPAVLHTYLGGQAGAGAVVDLLWGKVNPSGKLAESYPLKLEDHPAAQFFASNRWQTEYRESIFVGYRYYDAAQKEVLFPFGHGLSYTQFTYDHLQLSATRLQDTDRLVVRCKVKNTGERSGAEVVQLYVAKIGSPLPRPPQELKGFAKVYLDPGEEREVEFILDERAFAYHNVEAGAWHVEAGAYEIRIGASSRDIRLAERVQVESSRPDLPVPDYRSSAPAYYNLHRQMFIPREDFAAVYGRPIPAPQPPDRFDENSTLEDLGATGLGRMILKVARRAIWKEMGRPRETDPQWLMTWAIMLEMPLRSVAALSGGRIPIHYVRGLIAWANGERGRALRHWFWGQ